MTVQLSPSRATSPSGPASPDAAIELERLAKVYKTTRAVDGITFTIPRGSVTGLLGGNGAGKTTTISMIMGLVSPTSGRVSVLGCAMPEQSAEVLGRMNFESPYVDMPGRLTVRQNLTVFGRLYGVTHLKDRILSLAADLDLGEFLDRPSGKLSAGQKTRVALAKALINEPNFCCWTSRPRRSIRTPQTGSGAILKPTARSVERRSCWRRTTCLRSSGCATGLSS